MAALRLGILGCDTSHVVEFTRRLLHRDVAGDQWVDGATVAAAWPGTSAVAADRLPGFVQALGAYGVALVDRPEDLLDPTYGVDAVLLEAQEGATHRGLALPVLEAGLPLFVDKPFACSTEDAAAMVEVAARRHVPLLSASSLRFAPEVTGVAVGRVQGAQTHSPAALHPRNPGLFHYGVHGVEMLYALMGPGCRSVRCVTTAGADDVLGAWSDGRLGGMRGLRAGGSGYGYVAYGSDGVAVTRVGTGTIYRELLRVVVRVLGGGPSPVSLAEMVEAVAFQEAALTSARSDGAAVRLAVV